MVSLFNASLLGFFLFFIMAIQAKPLVESSYTSVGSKLPTNYQLLYELYKMLRVDPRLASVSNHDLIVFIYRNFIYSVNNDINSNRKKYSIRERHSELNNDSD
ncbi:unnamed protein product [Rotaria magnacalcarata]|uniref:Uncharacterized protein n=1 Tax=Rotaria magnacalcarata TaxID=392030 RepID=A0A819M8M3_9BILA|nr:unnamed protein product [Rotaria magnacalcarata]CAF1617474.1 unnamed protein product [Rotaria magnacalcarata]CAF1943022.1 unnamed protein product [Rotaria magnacalcarata]CAF2038673.1 unnamed protein product [Rotaria magnacalcarata]CAF2108563.1 unnamed protein product [Rotaria magnacalcarata]